MKSALFIPAKTHPGQDVLRRGSGQSAQADQGNRQGSLEGSVLQERVRQGRSQYRHVQAGFSSLEQDPIKGRPLVQHHEKKALVQLPPALPLSEKEMDAVYDLPYKRTWHPMYDADGGVPALAEVQFSVTSHRGCFGSCSFCAIHAHQGRIIQARSHTSILREVRLLTRLPGFKGYIHDIGGPTANFRHPSCSHQATC